jgi:hypothetical protein
MGVMARRTRDAASRHQGKDHVEPLFGFTHVLKSLRRRRYKKMLCKKDARHRWMAPPAEKCHISLETHIFSSVDFRVGFYGMAYKTYRLAPYLSDLTIAVEHVVGIDLGIWVAIVTLETDRSSVAVGAAPQEFGGTLSIGPTVDLVARQAPDLAVEQR